MHHTSVSGAACHTTHPGTHWAIPRMPPTQRAACTLTANVMLRVRPHPPQFATSE
jgi:hypothetical protein